MADNATERARRRYRCVHQLVVVDEVDFVRQAIAGYTELSICPLADDLRTVHLNASGQVVSLLVES